MVVRRWWLRGANDGFCGVDFPSVGRDGVWTSRAHSVAVAQLSQYKKARDQLAPRRWHSGFGRYSKELTPNTRFVLRSQPSCDSLSGYTRTRVALSYNCHSLCSTYPARQCKARLGHKQRPDTVERRRPIRVQQEPRQSERKTRRGHKHCNPTGARCRSKRRQPAPRQSDGKTRRGHKHRKSTGERQPPQCPPPRQRRAPPDDAVHRHRQCWRSARAT